MDCTPETSVKPLRSLRHIAALELHELDLIVTKYKQNRIELTSLLERHKNYYEQQKSMLRVKKQFAANDQYVVRSQMKLDSSAQELKSTLDGMASLASDAHNLWAKANQYIGQLNCDPDMSFYTVNQNTTAFNNDYRELQRAAELIRTHAKDLTGDIQIKKVQYAHCPCEEYERLLVAWKASTSVHDRGMDDLTALMNF